MKFVFEYRSSDNVKHNGVVNAADRDAAYSMLKRQGIRPSRLLEAPGVFNKILGKGKRWLAIFALVIISIVAVFYAARSKREALSTFDKTMRRQIIGDAEIINQGIRSSWKDVFSDEGEQFLSSYAIPGATVYKLEVDEKIVMATLDRKVEVSESDGLEARQIKAMVQGMKNELRSFLKDGGSFRQYCRRLVLRQREELSYYQKAKSDVDRLVEAKSSEQELQEVVTMHNASLRKMGIKLIVLSDQD